MPVLVLHEHGVVSPASDATHPLRILVPLDGSTFSETALLPASQLIATLAAPAQGEVHLFHVVDLPSVYGKLKSEALITDIMQEEARQEAEQEAERYMKSVADRCETTFAGFNLNVTSSIAVSTDVAGTILQEAEQARDAEGSASYDMIAIATHGGGRLRRLIMGSVAEHVLGTMKLPLLIVRPQPEETKGEGSDDTSQGEVTDG